MNMYYCKLHGTIPSFNCTALSFLPTPSSLTRLLLSFSGIPVVIPRSVPVCISSLSADWVISRRYWRSSSVQKLVQYPCRSRRRGRDAGIIRWCRCGGQTRLNNEVHYRGRPAVGGGRSIAEEVSLQLGHITLSAWGSRRATGELYGTWRKRRGGVVIAAIVIIVTRRGVVVIIVIPAIHDDS